MQSTPIRPITKLRETTEAKRSGTTTCRSHDEWWRRVFNRGVAEVAATFGVDSEAIWSRLTDRLLSIEYFPYWSKTFGQGALRLPSQQFSFGLVKRAIRRDATII